MNDIQRLLDAVSDPTSENQLPFENVRGWLAGYLEMRSDEVARFPGEASANHWDLLAADYDSSKEAHFIVVHFAGDQVTFMAGRGAISEVRAFALDDFPGNPDDVIDALVAKFTTSERWTTNADEVINWVQGQQSIFNYILMSRVNISAGGRECNSGRAQRAGGCGESLRLRAALPIDLLVDSSTVGQANSTTRSGIDDCYWIDIYSRVRGGFLPDNIDSATSCCLRQSRIASATTLFFSERNDASHRQLG